MAEAPEQPPASLVSLPDSILFELCKYLNERDCLALRAVSHALVAALLSIQADLGVWKPRVEVLLTDSATHWCAPFRRIYEQQFRFLRRNVAKTGTFLWPMRTLGGIVNVRLLSAGRLVATLTMRPGVGVEVCGARFELAALGRCV